MTPVIGADGCPAGWLAVAWGETVTHHLCRSFAEVLALEGTIVAVDMPIGLPEASGRPGDRGVRSRLGQRQSSVFAVPSRAAVMCEDYREACAVNLRHSDPPKKVGKQCFNLFAKMREIDSLMTPVLEARVYETHPELCFWAMNGEAPLVLAKKIRSRPHQEGLALRRELLRGAGFPFDALPPSRYRASDAGPDDILDACACAWSARRILEGRHITIPPDPPRDGRGLRMAIHA